MKNYHEAIISLMKLYKFSLIKIELNDDTEFYKYIVNKVNDYFEQLDKYEIEILKMRYIENFSLNKISCELNYKSHSSVSNIIKKAVNKLCVYEKN